MASIADTLAFYRDLLEFERDGARSARRPRSCRPAATTTTSAANTWNSLGAAPPPPGSAALERATIVLPDAGERDRLVARVADAGQEPDQRADGVVVRDPAGNALLLAA